jgi:outer membrane murein-binding lipoprotein Lpp
MLNMLKSVSIVSAVLVLAACASGPKYDDMKSSIPQLASDQGRIYFYRDASTMGAAVQPSIMLNGEKVGNSKPNGFFYVDRPAGKYEASCTTEASNKVTFVLAPGQERFVKTHVEMGFLVGHVRPELIVPEQGLLDIASLSYAPNKETSAAK